MKSERSPILGKDGVDTLLYIPPTKYNLKFSTLYKKTNKKALKRRSWTSEGPWDLWNSTAISSLVFLFAFYIF